MKDNKSRTAFRNVHLLTHIDDATYETLIITHRCNLDLPADDPFLLMCVLDDVYGFDGPDDAATTALCVQDRVLLFNEFHETPQDLFARRVGAVAAELGIVLTTENEDVQNPDLPYETIEDFVEALEVALSESTLRPFLFGVDNNAAIVFREQLEGDALPQWM